ncbi:hypothetical protein Nepgr_031357 [Nepenthes gracilis]|uniref:Uncharacterized protein n=1 Tax=Nepenthes gracilis TaxID=150966 RepID=A0AAD3THZ0_NEPGR|nr:hypothetical protein Nepgr_031357 [Nepenthes gracilis]
MKSAKSRALWQCPGLELDVELTQFNGPLYQSPRNVGLLEYAFQRLVRKDHYAMRLKVWPQFSRCENKCPCHFFGPRLDSEFRAGQYFAHIVDRLLDIDSRAHEDGAERRSDTTKRSGNSQSTELLDFVLSSFKEGAGTCLPTREEADRQQCRLGQSLDAFTFLGAMSPKALIFSRVCLDPGPRDDETQELSQGYPEDTLG